MTSSQSYFWKREKVMQWPSAIPVIYRLGELCLNQYITVQGVTEEKQGIGCISIWASCVHGSLIACIFATVTIEMITVVRSKVVTVNVTHSFRQKSPEESSRLSVKQSCWSGLIESQELVLPQQTEHSEYRMTSHICYTHLEHPIWHRFAQCVCRKMQLQVNRNNVHQRYFRYDASKQIVHVYVVVIQENKNIFYQVLICFNDNWCLTHSILLT